MAQSFINYLRAEGFISREEANAAKSQDGSDTPEQEGQRLVDAGAMTAAELSDALFFYNMNAFVEENTINLSEKHIEDDFFTEYLNIVTKGFHDFVRVSVTYDDVSVYSTVQEEYIIYQPLIGQGGNTFITGIAGPKDYLTEAAAALHKEMAAGLSLPGFAYDDGDMLDFYYELLNNINGTCSYKFNIDFDLDLPQYKAQATLSAPRIFTAKFSFLSYTVTVFLICGGAFYFIVN